MRHLPPSQRWYLALALSCILMPLLACGSAGLTTIQSARWACPSPTPLPYGPDGPVKARVPLPTATPTGSEEEAISYFAEWEQEYGALHGGPPFPSPTPYAIKGTTFLLGQRVAVGQLYVTVTAHAEQGADRPGVAPGTQQLSQISITWLNPTSMPIPLSYLERVRLRAVQGSGGAIITGDGWGISAEALRLAGSAPLPTAIPPGESSVQVPILGPVGQPTAVELRFDALPAPPIPGTPTTTPAANDALRRQEPGVLTVQWAAGSLASIGPLCDDPGVITPWGDGSGVAWGRAVDPGIAAPPGADRLVQIALNQVGKAYVWGARGPEAFDCSGLASWSYGQIGIRIPAGTAGQWPQLRPVAASALQPGDLVFFDIAGHGRIDHVGLLVGDLDGNGQWDMVHAASPMLGVRVEYQVFASAYYQPRLRGFRTVR